MRPVKMSDTADRGGAASADAHPTPVCPRCNGPVYRVRRRFVDRLISLVVPVRRYHCHSMDPMCDWEGNLRVKKRRSF